MKQVAKEEFWEYIMGEKRDGMFRIENPHSWPYTSTFVIKNSREETARVVEKYHDGKMYPLIKEYWLK